MHVLREREVQQRTSVSRTTRWRWERAGLFPARRQLGPNRVGWLEEDIERWITSRPRASSAHEPGTT